MRDNTCRNMILYAGKDKKKFYPYFYDLDLSWNFGDNYSLDIMTNSYAADMSLWENFYSLYGDEIANRYAYLRNTVLNCDYISALYKDIASNIPQEDVSLEYKKWGRGIIDFAVANHLVNVLEELGEEINLYLGFAPMAVADAEFADMESGRQLGSYYRKLSGTWCNL